ncbi:MAG: type II toxin-antitoxin system HicA family toxin [Patescibacteria group bacterium]
MAKTFSGKEVVKILSRKFGFYFVSQKGSHVKLRKRTGKRAITTIVPLHKELAKEEEFRKAA